MCGIAGRYNYLSHAPVQPELLRGMCELLAHRGPDGEGVYHQKDVGFGHRRLAVLDLTEAAHQPMVRGNGALVITYNGEIYNFKELRKTLEGFGHQFRSQSDTEVVLAAYEQYGVDCLRHLQGMFAFAIWDAGQRTLFLVRDRAGKKPLYYRVDRDGIAFASEPKAFLAEPAYHPLVDLGAIAHYLTYQYVPAAESAFHGVHKLLPAQYLLIKNGKIHVERYWHRPSEPSFPGSLQEAQEELLVKLKEAIRGRMISDVPLGAFLSGGLDSSVIVGLMAQLSDRPIKTFSIGFEHHGYNELPYAKLVARYFSTDHHEYLVTPKAMEIFPRLAWSYNEPFADSSAIPTSYLAQLTRKHVTVALNGDGGDENLLGYDRYRAMVLGDRFDHLPGAIRNGVNALAGLIPEPTTFKSKLNRVRRFVSGLGEPAIRRYGRWITHLDPEEIARVCQGELLASYLKDEAFSLLGEAFHRSAAPDLPGRFQDVDFQTYLPDDLLVKVDIATMAYGLEARSPFLDHHVIEFCASLPTAMKMRGSQKKYVLKQAVQSLLPQEIVNRPKMGFGVPMDHWLRTDLREMAYDLLLSDRAVQRGYFRKPVVEGWLDEHTKGRRDRHERLWNLLMLELWHRAYIDGEKNYRTLPNFM
ncbi:MAG: asparagine synthase (glutamine-hydrolyzing) [Nitrospirales bacterium]|nr:asparagine synthase (glutamine-hydrolyzing) [Nitrospirales bacterium]